MTGDGEKNPVWSYIWPWSNGDEHPPAFGRVESSPFCLLQ